MRGDRQHYTRSPYRLVTHLLSHKKTVTGIEAKGNSKINIVDILSCDAAHYFGFCPEQYDLFLKQIICFGQDCFVFTVNDISFTGMNFKWSCLISFLP